jgi:hypothetical protein
VNTVPAQYPVGQHMFVVKVSLAGSDAANKATVAVDDVLHKPVSAKEENTTVTINYRTIGCLGSYYRRT